MAGLLGVLGLSDSEHNFVNDVGHELIFDSINDVLARYNIELANLWDVFVERRTGRDTFRYLKPTGGMSQLVAEFAPAAPVGRIGSWDCAFPLNPWGDALAISRRGLGYTSVQELDVQLKSIMHRMRDRRRRQILYSLFTRENLTWTDQQQQNASLTIRRLANGSHDGVTYPPVLGATTELVEDHYLVAGYLVGAIATTTADPFVQLRDDVVHHFGGRTSRGEDMIVFINADAEARTRANMTDFVPIGDRYINYGEDTDLAQFITGMPGRVIGRTSGVWVSVYSHVPATYAIGVHLDQAPLIERIDTARSGLGSGLQLVAEEEFYPVKSWQYEWAYGFGAGNRLGAAVIQFKEAGNYDSPTFAEAG